MTLIRLLLSVTAVITSVAAQTVSCPAGWRLFEGHCYRLTDTPVRHDRVADACREFGAEPVSIHSSDENNLVAAVAGGKYVWLGLRVTGPHTLSWADGSTFSYSRFLPPGNSMLKRKFVGAGVFQQSCRRWNYGSVSRQRHGVCKAPAARCPRDALDTDGRCFFVAGREAPWWDAQAVCAETDPHSRVADLRMQDWQLNSAVTGNFIATTSLLVQVENEFSPELCSWTTIKYGQRTSHPCQYGCTEPVPVLCSRPKYLWGMPEPEPSVRTLPPIYRERGATELAEPLTECPPGWAPRGTRCISAPTEPATRLMADVHCQQLGGRMATVRGAYTKPILALQLTTVTEVWVLDPEASEIQYQIYKQKLIEEDNPHLMLPGYSALTAAGKVVTRPAEQQLPAICEQCTQPCSPGAVPFAGHCYQLLAGEHSLRTATDSCAALGAALVSVESMVENSFVAALAFNYSEPQCRSDTSQVWLGLHRGSVSFDWQWQDCSEFGIQFWAPGAGRSGFCGSLDAAGLWRDSDQCAQLRRLTVCEWDPCRADSDGYYGGCQLPPGPVY